MHKICVVVLSLPRSVSAAAPQASRVLYLCNRSTPAPLGIVYGARVDAVRALAPRIYEGGAARSESKS